MGDFGLSILDWRSPSLIFLSGNLSVVLVVLPRAGLAFPLFHLFYFLAGLGCFSESVVDKVSTEKASCIRIKQPAAKSVPLGGSLSKTPCFIGVGKFAHTVRGRAAFGGRARPLLIPRHG